MKTILPVALIYLLANEHTLSFVAPYIIGYTLLIGPFFLSWVMWRKYKFLMGRFE